MGTLEAHARGACTKEGERRQQSFLGAKPGFEWFGDCQDEFASQNLGNAVNR